MVTKVPVITKEVLAERKRIKELYSTMLDEVIEGRLKMKKKRSRRVMSITDAVGLKERFFWYVDDPDYVRV